MLYEGNDFRDSNYERENSITHKVGNYFKASPLRIALERFLLKKLGRNIGDDIKNQSAVVNEKSEKEETNQSCLSALSWLPIVIPTGPEAKYYTFTVKSVCDHYRKKESFLRSKGYKQTIIHLRQIKKICDTNNTQLIIVYAPDKPHVLMPLICNIISSDTLKDFMALNERKLPPSDKIKDEVLNLIDTKELVFKEFCKKETIDFVSLTDSLRNHIALGEQLYFTYDNHWTPIGHEVVANTINDFLSKLPETKTEQKIVTENSN